MNEIFYPAWYFAGQEHVEIVCTCGQPVHVPVACLEGCDGIKTLCVHCGEVVEMQRE